MNNLDLTPAISVAEFHAELNRLVRQSWRHFIDEQELWPLRHQAERDLARWADDGGPQP